MGRFKIGWILSLLLLSLAASGAGALPYSRPADSGRGKSEEGRLGEWLKGMGIDIEKTAAGVKWLYILMYFSSFAGLYLLVHAVTGGGLFPAEIEEAAKRTCLGILLSTLILSFYCFTAREFFLFLLPLGAAPLILPRFYAGWRTAYRIKFARTGKDCWICRTCSRENHSILAECPDCSSPHQSRS